MEIGKLNRDVLAACSKFWLYNFGVNKVKL